MITHTQYAEALREIADWYERHQDIPLPSLDVVIYGGLDKLEILQQIARSAPLVRKHYRENLLDLIIPFAHGVTLTFTAWRHVACERKVVGTREIPEQVVPEHIEPQHTEEVIEWVCTPLLAASEKEGV